MKLYRSKIPLIAKDCIETLARDGDIEVAAKNKPEAENDLAAIMNDFIRRDASLRERTKDRMAADGMSYSEFGSARKKVAEASNHPVGDDIERYLVRQFVECLMVSRFVEEVYAEDTVIYKKLMDVVRAHDVNEDALRDEASSRIKNAKPGTVEYELAMQEALREVKKRHGLM